MTGLANKLGVLSGLSETVRTLTAAHKRPLEEMWFPSDAIVPLLDRVIAKDDEFTRQVAAIPMDLWAALVLHLLTEAGLPHFHRLIAQHLGEEHPWKEWNNLWTAEEDRHGMAIDQYILITQVVNRNALELMRFEYIDAGFHPKWGKDPYQLLAYTVLQERATQVSHKKLGTKIATYEPVFGKLLQRIAGDEARHYAFYKAVFLEVLEADADEALQSLHTVMMHFTMPGASAPRFADLQEIEERSDIFTAADYREIVATAITLLGVADLKPKTDRGKKALDRILGVPKVLDRVVRDNAKKKAVKQTFAVPFLQRLITV
ncbi:MAG TPA: acyl-ACP desaturase [Candidatus Paceibacterota bacterium]|nr:acyl-ACP desaturase [Candidatus Paceibacterota bacterium]